MTRDFFLFGHLDEYPYGEHWHEGLGPTTPVVRNGKLYGRGGADDGYSVFSALLAIKLAQIEGKQLPRICLALETDEESGSNNLIELLTLSEEYRGKPDCIFILDAPIYDFEQLWITSSLRGLTMVDLQVECAISGYHSGEVGGIVPETFRIIRSLLDRVDDTLTGRVNEVF